MIVLTCMYISKPIIIYYNHMHVFRTLHTPLTDMDVCHPMWPVDRFSYSNTMYIYAC